MRLMKSHEWYDHDVEEVWPTTNPNTREIIFKDDFEGVFLISVDDAIALVKEFGLVVYQKNSSL